MTLQTWNYILYVISNALLYLWQMMTLSNILKHSRYTQDDIEILKIENYMRNMKCYHVRGRGTAHCPSAVTGGGPRPLAIRGKQGAVLSKQELYIQNDLVMCND